MRNLSWFQARLLARQYGKRIRRESWRRWICWTGYYLYFSNIPAVFGDDPQPEQWHVVRADEFTDQEFLARDWTDEPWDVTTAVTPQACPAGYAWDVDFHACVATSGGMAGGLPGSEGGSSPVVLPADGQWSQPGNQAESGSAASGATGGIIILPPSGGAPSGTGSNSSKPQPPHAPPPAQEPVVTAEVQIANLTDGDNCYMAPPDFVRVLVQVSVQGGNAGVGAVSVDTGLAIPKTSTGWPGMVMVYEFVVPCTPGSTATVSINYQEPPLPGGEDHTITVSFTFPPYCYGYGP